MENRWRKYQERQTVPKKGTRRSLLLAMILGVGLLVFAGPLFQDSIQGVTPETSQGNDSASPLILQSDAVYFNRTFVPDFSTTDGDHFVQDLDARRRVVYTIDPVLQREMEDLFDRYRVPYGMFVAMDPGTGRILAMVEHSDDEPASRNMALRATYPAASIFKLVTASAAMEKGKVTPESQIRFRGGLYDMNPRNWKDNPRRDKNTITLTDALAKSCNIAFAKVALHSLKAQDLKDRAVLFGFNRDLDFELPVDVSAFHIQKDEKSLAMTAAGFGDVNLSPLHGAMIASMIANGGIMMSPRIVERVIQDGKEVYTLKERSLGRAMRTETAEQLAQMMAQTIKKGTSRHAFYGWGKLPDLQMIRVGGKTGSLEGDNPPGDYNWFVGMAPLQDAKIAVAALVINHQRWQIKASYVAREGLKTYFRNSPALISQNPISRSGSGSRG